MSPRQSAFVRGLGYALALAAVSVGLVSPARAVAAPTITEFTTGLDPATGPFAIAEGPDGNLWFTAFADPGGIGRITPAGTITEFTTGMTPNSAPQGIAAGSDGNLWFTEGADPGRIGRITPTGTITEFTTGLTPNSVPQGIAAGPDGNLWFTEERDPARIGRITPAGRITEFTTGLTPNSRPIGIAPGPDGNLWFTEDDDPGRIGRITPTGTITEFSAGLTPNSQPFGIAPGPDGNLWFTEAADPGRIGRITPTGTITEFSAGLSPNSGPAGIAAGPDGNLWFAENLGPGRIGRITPTGTISEFSAGLTPNARPIEIAAGADGNLCFTEFENGIGRVTSGPGVLTGATSGISSAAASVTGSVRPNSQLTTFQFQFGTDTSYGSETPAQLVGQDAAEHPVSAALRGLSPGTTYHYRLVATNPSDTTLGADRTFTTSAAGGAATAAAAPAKANFTGSRSSITVDRKRRFSFSFRADPGLTGTATFRSVNRIRVSRAARRKQRLTVARRSFSVAPSGRVTLRIRLSRQRFRILQLNHKIGTRLTVTLGNAAGLTSTASKRITLKAPK
jgi:streptogramin lyase